MAAGTAGPATAVPLVWTRVFPATPPHARAARRFLSRILDGSPAADEAILCLSELATNAMIHSHSSQPGGHFTVRAEIREGDRLRVEVQDQGGSWTRHPTGHDAPHGRGLLILARLASDWGRSGDSQAGWTVWFELCAPMTGRPDQSERRAESPDISWHGHLAPARLALAPGPVRGAGKC